MKQQLLDLIHLNTYVDYSANKASTEDINDLISKVPFKLDDEYLNFLRELNGFKMYNLLFYGTKSNAGLFVEDPWYFNKLRHNDHPALAEYFLVAEGFEEVYAYSSLDNKYYALTLYDDALIEKVNVFNDLDSMLDHAIRSYAKRLNEQLPIIEKESLLCMTARLDSVMISHNFRTTGGNFLESHSYGYERESALGSERISITIQTNRERNVLYVRIGASKRYDLVESFFDMEDLDVISRIPGNSTINLSSDLTKIDTEFSVQKVNNDPEALAHYFTSFIETSVLPAFSLYDDLKLLDANVNQSPSSIGNISADINWYHKLIIAKLAGNPSYEEIFGSIKERLEKAVLKHPDNQKYTNYLRLLLKVNSKLQRLRP